MLWSLFQGKLSTTYGEKAAKVCQCGRLDASIWLAIGCIHRPPVIETIDLSSGSPSIRDAVKNACRRRGPCL